MIQLLVVDDDDINIFLLNHLLKKSGYPVETVSFTNPVEALQYINSCVADDKKIDLLFLDINMPQMTGWDVLHELRIENISKIPESRIYMLSSSVHATDSEKAAQFPEVSGFISKPVTPEFLSEVFSTIMLAKQL
ncbi:response regulator [Flavihumibacter sp. R14]|nr:response regulator [Flavihumibacter soli]